MFASFVSYMKEWHYQSAIDILTRKMNKATAITILISLLLAVSAQGFRLAEERGTNLYTTIIPYFLLTLPCTLILSISFTK